jgi:hypothetical protein
VHVVGATRGGTVDCQFGEGVEPVAVQEHLVVGERLGFEVEFAAELVVHLEHRLDERLVLAPIRIRDYLVFKQGRCDRARHARTQAAPTVKIDHNPGPVEVEKLHSCPRDIGGPVMRSAVPNGRLMSAEVHPNSNGRVLDPLADGKIKERPEARHGTVSLNRSPASYRRCSRRSSPSGLRRG